MTLSLRQKLLVVYASALLVLAVGGIAYWMLLRLRSSADGVVHTREVIATVNAVVAELTAAESALRAFEVTGERRYLEPSREAPALVGRELAELRRLVGDDPAQVAKVDVLQGAVAARLQALRIAAAGQGGPITEVVARGTSLMQRVRQAAAEVRAEQERRLALRQAHDRRTTRQATLLVLLSALLAALLAALLSRALLADSEARTRAARMLEQQRTELERGNQRLVALNAELEAARENAEQRRREAELLRERAERGTRIAEAAREATQRSLQEITLTQEVRNRFMAMTTHEIRQPINAILGFAQLLELGVTGPLTEGQQVHVQRIIGSGRHLRTLVDDFLDLAKAEVGQLTVERTLAPVASVATEALELVTPQAAERGVLLRWSCGDGATHYAGDPDRVRQILVNLLSNAVKFSPAGSEVLLECELQEPAGRVAYHVRDSGPGIAQEDVSRLFDPYTQTDQGRGHQGSTGLGLTVSRKLAELMDGTISVNSSPGQGSTFTLILPQGLIGTVGPAGSEVDDERAEIDAPSRPSPGSNPN